MSANAMSQSVSVSSNQENNSANTRLVRYLPLGLSIVAAALIIVSMSFPYWRMVLDAPQYPQGLEMRVFVNYMTGDEDQVLDDVKEIDGLNHYIGMQSLYTAAQLEQSIAIPAIILTIIFAILSTVWKWRWAWLLAIPAIGFPFVYLGDLAFWLNHYGQNLDPYAPLSSAIKPFTPPILGEGVIGNFRTIASIEIGWFIAVGAGVLMIVAMIIKTVLARREANVPTA